MKNTLFVLLLLGFLVGGNGLAGEKKDRHGEDLSEQDFSGKSLNGWNFSDCNLKNATFRNSSLKNANFKDAILYVTIFNGADMTGADMRGLKEPFPTFDATNLSKSNWEGSEIGAARHTNFREANLKKTKFSIFACNNCDFRGADLRGANLRAPTKIGFSQCRWKEAIYDEDTAFPDGFDPQAEGLILRKLEKKDDKKKEDKK